MNIFPIRRETQNHQPIEKSKSYYYSIPLHWWHTSSSYNFENLNNIVTTLHEAKNLPKLQIVHGEWKINKGDYRVKDFSKKDYVYYRELRHKLWSYSIIPFVLITVLTVAFISSLIEKI